MRFSAKGSIDFGYNKSSSKKSFLEKIKEKVLPDTNEEKEGVGGTINYDIGVDMSVEEFNAIHAANRADADAVLEDTRRAIDAGKLLMDWIRSEINPTIQAIADGSKLYQKLDHEIDMERSDLHVELTLKKKANSKKEEAESEE